MLWLCLIGHISTIVMVHLSTRSFPFQVCLVPITLMERKLKKMCNKSDARLYLLSCILWTKVLFIYQKLIWRRRLKFVLFSEDWEETHRDEKDYYRRQILTSANLSVQPTFDALNIRGRWLADARGKHKPGPISVENHLLSRVPLWAIWLQIRLSN